MADGILFVQIGAGRQRGDGTVGNGGGQLANLLCTAVSCGKQTGCRGGHMIVCQQIARFIRLNQMRKDSILRFLTNGDKEAADVERFCLAGHGIRTADTGQFRRSEQLLND